MATCKTCGAAIEIPEGWGVGASVRRHYWSEHPERMLKTRADKAADEALARPDATQPKGTRGDGTQGKGGGRLPSGGAID
ncbi:MAG TPA: hypothetical protein VKY26_10350 [Actinomycetota bacterium]|nr:hypothetical protein [Actinomycetota bacterium]